MKRKIKQILSAMLAIVMLVGIVPLADLDVDASALEINGSVSFADGKYVLDKNGTLTVTGTGTFLASEMYYYMYNQDVNGTTNNYLNLVRKIVVEDGITSIWGYLPTDYMHSCIAIVIPISVVEIGDGVVPENALPYIFYKGTEEQWKEIEIGKDNYISNDKMFYNYDGDKIVIDFGLSFTLNEEGSVIYNLSFFWWGALWSYLGNNSDEVVERIELTENVTEIGFSNSDFDNAPGYFMENIESFVIPKSVNIINKYATYPLTRSDLTIYYRGTEEEWNEIIIENGCGITKDTKIHYNYRQDIQNVTYLQQEDTHKDFTVTANGRQQMIQFIEPDGGTRTYDRYNKNVSITSYNADGEVVNAMSRDLAYEVWNIHSNMSVGVEIKVRGKENYVWDSAEYSFTIEPYNPIVSMELSTTSGKKGPVPATVVADEKTEKVMFKMQNNTSVTVASTATDENGNKIFTGNAWMNEDGLNEIEVKIYRKNVWKTVGTLEYIAE